MNQSSAASRLAREELLDAQELPRSFRLDLIYNVQVVMRFEMARGSAPRLDAIAAALHHGARAWTCFGTASGAWRVIGTQ